MHRSQLAGFIIDCETDDLEAPAKFWSQALGQKIKQNSPTDGDSYMTLETGPHGLHIELQKVSHPSRVHLDIETDDIEAEVSRLEKLGAKRIKKIRSWWVMEAPTGHRFCVVNPLAKNFVEQANRFD